MSFDFNNINPIKAQSVYKDGGGLGGGGMYMRQGKKRKEEDEEDMFERRDDKNEHEIELDPEIREEDIPHSTLFNKFVNWFRLGRE